MSMKKSFLNRFFDNSGNEDELIEQLFTNILINDFQGVQELLLKDVPMDQPDTLGRLPIHLAVIKDRFNMIGPLKEKGADLNQRNNKQLTPLMLAVKYNALESARELLVNGANPYLKNLEGKTVEQIAKEGNNSLFLQLFKEHQKNSYQATAIRHQNDSLKFDKVDKDFNLLLEKAEKREKELEREQAIQQKKQLESELKKKKNEKLNKIEQAYQAKLQQFRKLANNKQLSQKKCPTTNKNLEASDPATDLEVWKQIKQDDLEAFKEFLQRNPSLEVIDKQFGYSPLTYSLLKDKADLFEVLLEAGAQVNTTYNNNSLLYLAVKKRKPGYIDKLLTYGADTNLVVDDISPLELALDHKSIEIITSLLEGGANVNHCGTKGAPIITIIKSNLPEFIPLLISYGFKLDELVLGRSPLEWCILHNNIDVFKELVRLGANINIGREDGNALICKIVKSGRYWFLDLMIKNQADLNVLDIQGRSPLEIAIVDNEIKIVKSLLEGGASVQLSNADQLTPLQVARRLGRWEIIKLLESLS